MKRTVLLIIAVLACAIPVGVAVAGVTVEKSGKGKPALYVGAREENGSGQAAKGPIQIGNASTAIVSTPPLPAGKYHITYTVGLIMGEHENVVCGLNPGFNPTFGTAGNPAAGAPIYGTASANEYIEVTTANQEVGINCNKTNSSPVEAELAVVTAEKIGTQYLAGKQ